MAAAIRGASADAWRLQVIFGALILILWLCKLYADFSTHPIAIKVKR
jgi:hypothetical protein